MTYKQPHEGIRGIDRSDNDLLSLEPSAVAHRFALAALVRHLSDATGVGNPAPIVKRMGGRLRSPKPGDLVIEWTGIYPNRRRHSDDDRIKAMGYFIEKRVEWWQTDEEWEKQLADELAVRREWDGPDAELDDEDRERPTDQAWYIQYGQDPGAICRWTNCSFVVVPIDFDMFRLPVGTADGNGVLITRESLLSSLADSGHALGLAAGGES